MTLDPTTAATILATVERLIIEIAGDEITLAGPITLATSFNGDLELESIEFVALAEKLQEHYGARIDFVGWISTKELDQIIALTVGELVEFIARAPA
ncbi:MAG: acyl carrier protein [Myxococcales bacterium]|nr:acyl carrier protein [Myxococcales bacterium]